jgi:hypothetical protein
MMLLPLGIVAVACGGGATKASATSPPATPPATTIAPPATTGPPCTPSGTTLQISAQPTDPQTGHPSFDEDCLAAPADSAFRIAFDIKDTDKHNISIYTNVGASTPLFKGRIVDGPAKVTYNVKALRAGEFYFRCDIHPIAMHGTFVVTG